jgi:hypothetical protein
MLHIPFQPSGMENPESADDGDVRVESGNEANEANEANGAENGEKDGEKEIDSDEGEEEGEEEKERDKNELPPKPTRIVKPIRPLSSKMPKHDQFFEMGIDKQKSIYKQARRIMSRQIQLIAGLRQEIDEQRAIVALGSGNDNNGAYYLNVESPDNCIFPKEIGVSGLEFRDRSMADWVVLSRNTLTFDISILYTDHQKRCSMIDPMLGTETQTVPLSLKVTLHNDQGEVLNEPKWLAYKSNARKEDCQSELYFNMTTNCTQIDFVMVATSQAMKEIHGGNGKFKLKFETKFKNIVLEKFTRPFLLTWRLANGRNKGTNDNDWELETINTLCKECACCAKRL